MDIISDITPLKISALKKASRISAEVNCITIGPKSKIYNKIDTDSKLENIKNEQNSCNIKSPQKTNVSPIYDSISTANEISFSVKKILLESEEQRKEEVRKKMKLHIQNMKKNERAILELMANSRKSMARERERRIAENLACIIAEEDRIAEQEEIKRRHEQQLYAQRAQEQKEKMKEKEELMRAVMVQRDQFTAKYFDIVALSETCKNKYALNILFTSLKIKELWQKVEAIDERIKTEELLKTDLNMIEELTCKINDMMNLFRTEIEKINAQYEIELCHKTQIGNEIQSSMNNRSTLTENTELAQQLNENDTVKMKEDKSQNFNEIMNQETSNTTDMSSALCISNLEPVEASKDSIESKNDSHIEYIDKESLQIYMKSKQYLAVYKESYKNFLESSDTKKFRFECQKAINIPVNAIAGTSEQHLRDKYDRLQNLLTGKSAPNVMQYPHGLTFCKDYLAKKIVEQGETLVSSKPEMAFPIAAIVIALWNEHENFGELLLAHLHEACPFTVPVFLPQQEDQSNEDYYRSLGYKYSEDGTIEQQDKFLKRMSGFIRLYASITVTGQRKGITKAHPHGLQQTWRWLAATMNIEPKADMCDLCATLILDMLEVAGNILCTTYPKQFHKLLTVLMEQYYPLVQKIAGAGSGPLVRLEEFLRNALTKGTISPANGLLPPNFW